VTLNAVERLLGAPVIGERPVSGGYTMALRRIVTLADGRTAFVKAPVDDLTREWLRAEQRIYAQVSGTFLPEMLACDDDVLVLEDLSDGHWPPPWRDGDVRAVIEALDRLHALTPPPGLPHPQEVDDLRGGWADVAADPEPFLSLGLASAAWLRESLPALLDAAERAQLDGDSLVHLDVRSDNLCLRDGRCLIVDWNWAARGNPRLDLAFWLPSLRLEGGPEPETLAGEGMVELAALCAGFFACRAGRPEPSAAHNLRAAQRAQLEVALPWAARSLGLSRPRPR
jgi:hypothetical protein